MFYEICYVIRKVFNYKNIVFYEYFLMKSDMDFCVSLLVNIVFLVEFGLLIFISLLSYCDVKL